MKFTSITTILPDGAIEQVLDADDEPMFAKYFRRIMRVQEQQIR